MRKVIFSEAYRFRVLVPPDTLIWASERCPAWSEPISAEMTFKYHQRFTNCLSALWRNDFFLSFVCVVYMVNPRRNLE